MSERLPMLMNLAPLKEYRMQVGSCRQYARQASQVGSTARPLLEYKKYGLPASWPFTWLTTAQPGHLPLLSKISRGVDQMN